MKTNSAKYGMYTVSPKVVQCDHCQQKFEAIRHKIGPNAYSTSCKYCGQQLIGGQHEDVYHCHCEDCLDREWVKN